MIVPPWPLRAKRRWFAERDGSGYYRNCPLIMGERKAALSRGRLRLAARLGDEWDAAWRAGTIRQARLGRHDVLVTPVPFREAYPQYPGLWRLDDPEGSP